MDFVDMPDYDNKTREDLIEIIEQIRRSLNMHTIMVEGLNHPDPEVVVTRNSDKKYTCECGCQILIRNRKRHEASAKHIRGVVQIRE